MKRNTFLKVLLIGGLVACAVPPTINWEKVYALTSSSSSVRSVEDIQKKLLNAMNKHQESVEFEYSGKTDSLKEQLKKALSKAMESDPYINYTIESYGYSYRGNSKTAQVTVQLSYRETAQQTAYVSTRAKQILKSIIKPGMNDHAKIKAIHDWVVLNLKYDVTLQKYTAYDGLSSGSTVCQGYSLLTYKLLKEAGITNKIVEGSATPSDTGVSQLHAWNLVLLDGEWYHLDTTWDDPAPDRPGEIGIGYYMRTDEQMRRDHQWTKSYPAASTLYRNTLTALANKSGSDQAMYTNLERQLEYQLFNKSEVVHTTAELRAKAKPVIKQKQHALLFRFAGTEKQLIDVLQDLYPLGVRSISYVHSPFEDTGDLKVYVTWK
ncbi:transglutaminase domain-containing protein [Paenibacillus pini]|uniref:Transglutaminase n=1 Tax=Paenibacillus pini JCM 16418 TaxID=1236976 RepID=W7Z7T9_9BACL|nr:transglutaminase domain-containing protein [Paenibacillus pini]GAF10479.1 transglutaminase [Paenibacillus pini JCM 16418]